MASTTTYPPLAAVTPSQAVPIQSIPLLPAQVPPLPPQLPPLPVPQRLPDPSIDSQYELKTHLVPAAYPRITPHVPDIQPPAWSDDKQTRKANVDKVTEEVMAWKRKQYEGKLPGGAEGHGNTRLLWNCVNHYVRRRLRQEGCSNNTGKPLTLFFAHPNGLHKETWEPTISHFLAANAASKDPLDIAEIWSFEAVNHGDAALVNAANLGGVFDWTDHARDILHFLLSYLPSSPTTPADSLPTHLPRLPETLAKSRRTFGFQQRTLVAIPHSFSGCATTLAAVDCPAVFSAIILVDPIYRPLRPGVPFFTWREHSSRATGAVRRRTHWPSREEAYKQYLATPFFAAWDPAVLRLFIDVALYDDPKGGVNLKMSGIQEAMVFAEAYRTYEAWQLAPDVDVRIPMYFALAGKIEDDEHVFKHELAFRRPANSKNVILTEASHLVAQEAPKTLAEVVFGLLHEQYAFPRARARL